MSGYHTKLINMTFQTSCIDCKPRESLRDSNTDVSLISKMCFAVLGFRINTNNTALHIYKFFSHPFFGIIDPIEEV